MTATSAPAPVADKNLDLKIPGRAIYLEFHDAAGDGLVAQFLIVSQMVNPTDGSSIPFQLVSRVIGADNPKRKWRPFGIKQFADKASINASQKRFNKDKPVEDAVKLGAEYYAVISNTIDATAANSWKLHKKPLLIQVTREDAVNFAQAKSPRGLLDRLRRLRTEQDFGPLPGEVAA